MSNEDGTKTPEEIAAELQTQLVEKEKTNVELAERVKKLESKDMNFKKLRDMTEEELSRLSSFEKGLKEEQEKLGEETRAFASKVVESHKADALSVLAGSDEEMRKKVLHHYERLKDEAVTKEEIANKMREAWLLAGGSQNHGGSSIAGGLGSYSPSPSKSQKGTELSESQKALAASMGISDETLKKYNK